jgi:hypothetical protein
VTTTAAHVIRAVHYGVRVLFGLAVTADAGAGVALPRHGIDPRYDMLKGETS